MVGEVIPESSMSDRSWLRGSLFHHYGPSRTAVAGRALEEVTRLLNPCFLLSGWTLILLEFWNSVELTGVGLRGFSTVEGSYIGTRLLVSCHSCL